MAILNNYKPVLAFAAIVVGGVAIFGSSLSTGYQAPDDNNVRNTDNSTLPSASASEPPSNVQAGITDFSVESELVDDTSGIDPIPEISFDDGDFEDQFADEFDEDAIVEDEFDEDAIGEEEFDEDA